MQESKASRSGAIPDSEARLEAGLGHHQAGRLAEAERTYREVLAEDPNHPVALHLLGLLLNQHGQHERGVQLIQRALEEDPGYAPAHYDLGNILRDLGRVDESERALRRAVELWPEWPEAQFNFGLILEARGDLDGAANAYRSAVAAKPDFAKALLCLAVVLRKLRRTPEADASCRQLLALTPDSADAFHYRGKALFDLERPEEALENHDKAIALRPEFTDAHIDRGNALYQLMRHEAALESYERAIALKSDVAVAHLNRGTALVALHRHEAALESYERAIALAPDFADAHLSRGNALSDLKRYEAALASYERAVALRPDHALAHFALAQGRLQLGDFERGREGFEWRWKVEGFELPGPSDFPLWRGAEALHGRTILLHAEQGLGDTLQFCRYAPRVAALGATVTLQVQRPLVRLLAGLEGVAQVLPQGAPLPAFDCHCPLMSLPLAFATDLASIPAATPYLRAQPDDVARWKARVGDEPGLKVGLVWAGDARKHLPDANRIDRIRSLALAQLAPLARVRGVRFFSLQKAGPALQARNPPQDMALRDYTDELRDFADTAALVSNLDLVISVDTSVAHLAGGLGVPVWMLSRYNGCWRWLLERDDSPWYPSMRLFRQTRWGDWQEVVDRVAAALADRVRA